MDINGEYRIGIDRDAVWKALNDPQVLRRCIPGCESLEMESETRLRARIMAAIGPVRSRFDTVLTLQNLNPPESYTLSGESKGGAAGFGRGSADVRLSETGGATLLAYSARLQLGGRLAQVGSRLVQGATQKMANDFFGNFSRELDPDATRVAGAPEPRTTANWRRVAAAIALAALALLIWWFLLR